MSYDFGHDVGEIYTEIPTDYLEGDEGEESKLGWESEKALAVDLEEFDFPDVIALIERLREKLPKQSLADFDMEQEAVLNYQLLHHRYQKEVNDMHVSANQLSALANAVRAAAEQLDSLQNRRYSPEAMRTLESVLSQTLGEFPGTLRKNFVSRYQEKLREIGFKDFLS